MSRGPKPKLIPCDFGPLPVQGINAALALELDPGEVVMSVRAQQHVQRKRPQEFARCFPHVASVILTPLYVRDDFNNDGKIEMVGRPAGLAEWLLVAVEVSIDSAGKYNITSFYPLSETKVEKRREAGHYRRVLLI
ncbi:MAG: hypothetical protein B7Y36_09990 [Novosphingobium sp. 28-62-57]|uniref:hypothetical protein n=1 Tax=Novosphingobium sp. TaxID=1874826 RepID=UPI000BC6FB6C|nr:hypothetical protein [Novosphingobium sp.]OYW51342.1 MAG: hypothetical protein B7Z34_00590 [Novosphingobium sp. 12-62-10]OYZ10520.1 MAG: hypothetical protein B7Y36_09990 [Novosphingobium sp. 28-62-57]OZA36491.1 MAG: hypothetical protein B7X92_06250 [Novosphingobium sp. 17-62-9]